jgi:hypothetical protein
MKAFLGAFDVIPGALWALLLAGALALIGVKQVQLSTARTATAEARLDLANYKATAAESARLAERAERAKDARINTEQRKAFDEAATQILTAQADAADARAAGEQLRLQAQRYADAARRASARAASVEAGAAAADPLGVFADVLGRIDQRAGRLAEIADASRIAGQLCERSYDALGGP